MNPLARRIVAFSAVASGLAMATIVIVFGVLPRPPDTTDPRIFEGDPLALDYCDLPLLDGSGLTADEIPKAFTPGCNYERFPMPILQECSEPLAPGVVDMRGLWLSYTSQIGHVERIEQCGNRTVVTTSGVIHDFRTDGTLANGSRDVEPPSCINTFVAIDFQDGVMRFHPFGLPITLVTRRMDDDELVWTYPGIDDDIRMKRLCELPPQVLEPRHLKR
jgi:hypothetical protein